MITNQNMNQMIEFERKQYKHTEIYRIITAVLLVAIILLLLLLQCHCDCGDNEGIPWDSNVTYDENQKASAIDALNQKVADGMIRISMNADPIFENGTAKGNVNIQNKNNNTRPQVVEIYLKDSDGTVNKEKLVYRSGKIPVGGKIQSVALDKKLSKGNYKAWAGFNAISDNDEIVGTAGADITLHILN